MRQWTVLGILMLILSACAIRLPSPERPPMRDENLEDLGVAPELSNQVWLNTQGPLRLADLRGKVVLLDMWTFG